MPWNSLPASQHIPVIGFSIADEKNIKDALYALYTLSPSAKALMDEAVNNNYNVSINFTTGTTSTYVYTDANGNLVRGFNYNPHTPDLLFLSEDGRIIEGNIALILVHELSHAIRITQDPLSPVHHSGTPSDGDFTNPNYDHIGSALAFEQIVQRELVQNNYSNNGQLLGIHDIRKTYNTSIEKTDVIYKIGLNKSITEEKVVDVILSTNLRPNNTVSDLSLWNENALIVDVNNQVNLFRGGGGSDYIYGGLGDDLISGGSGNNVLHGGFLT